ncbi:DAGAT-domain-containing protein [Punctularia strigosozonata HHB-11173 SS5]|uniref:DAGAT-domain-containing protein n=1 Tax=Punctularia strigosozonata (strain HHB-11173) TaxID=741275 RepID=UPI00044186C0|nr:DAGAT-domain-containing protein [Punctularia strigosozonata HHB-11173 SS5]EIN06275.1 DAGAT-domain-containing protein [Punctularia strigosozonata HHB-11173 SS5]
MTVETRGGIPRTVSATSFSPSILKDRLSHISAQSLQPVKALHGTLDFVPAKIPRQRRLQTLVVAIWSLMIPIMLFIWLLLCSIPALWPVLAIYYIWKGWIDGGPEHGGRISPWFRSAWWWKYFAEYYPASFRMEAPLPPDRPYVFGYHPHGIIGRGAIATFATEATGFSKAFPGIVPHLLTLTSNFQIPLYRDIMLALGICSVSKQSCSNILRRGPGQAITIVVGGAAESLAAHPGTADLTLRKRLGFIKIAIQHGAALVPVFSFGENDIYQQMPNDKGTLLYTIQKKFQSVFGFTLPLFHGRGMLNYNLGLMPYRRQIVSVIGRPILCDQCDSPTMEEVTRVQQQYIAELMRIWETYKDIFARSRKRELSIID